MIILLDFSIPRKLSYNMLNDFIFHLKMKKHIISKYKKATVIAIASSIIKNSSLYIADSSVLINQFNIYDMGSYIELYGIPTCYYKIELSKIKEDIYQSILLIKSTLTSNIKVLYSTSSLQN
ncbi:MAG: hypothetical protein GX895_00315 [Clostridiales bacterium]|uniref:hypothetical protein n=1 Tax=Clostridium sp. N3C TaxID=1776758 RepID=UPI00092E1135|nr:hypothetical protein [Clostridium sp. N3C]NLZ47231.1 hypothetical protein [Clostridiales bacterium]SCN21701.1 hypothetical protein N3C_0373 [Clostridium sp. N3C]